MQTGRLLYVGVNYNCIDKKKACFDFISQASLSLNSCCARTSWEIRSILCHNFSVTQDIPGESTFKISNKEDFKLHRGDLALIKLGVSVRSTSHIYLFIPMVLSFEKTVWCIEVKAHG